MEPLYPEHTIIPVEQHPPPAHSRMIAISDGRPGNARQAEALAHAILPGQVERLHISTRAPWRWASPRWLPGSTRALGAEFQRLMSEPPRWAVGCGRQAALATRLLHQAGSQVVHILNPRIAHRHWDLVILPEHDGITGSNVIPIRGSLNPVDDAWLAAARVEFAQLERYPSPRLTLLIGGDARHGRLPACVWQQIMALMAQWHRDRGGSVLVTTSRRTPPALAAELTHQMHTLPGLCWTGAADGANPYAGLLAYADQIVCTADSVNLLSEACATRAPVCIVGAETAPGGPGRFARDLLNTGRASASLMAASVAITPLRETERIAALVRERLFAPDGVSTMP